MSRWWRAYDEAVDDPKLGALTDRQHRAWFNLCCITSQNGGTLPPMPAVAFKLRMTVEKAKATVAELVALKLFDIHAGTQKVAPHNWTTRQYKTDVTDPTAAQRAKRYRDKRRDGHRDATVTDGVTDGVTDKRPETEAETEAEKITEADASGADAPPPPVDHRKRLFGEGLTKLAAMTGKGPDACRSFVGKCLKSAGDDAVVVLGLIEDAERNQTIDPAAWIASRLRTRENSTNGRRTVHDAARDLHQQTVAAVLAFDEPAPRGLRDAAGDDVVRLLPAGGRERS